MHKKHIMVLDSIVVFVTLVTLVGIFMFARPTLYSPTEGYSTTGAVLFSFERGEIILIDDNLDFTSPQKIIVKDNIVVHMQPGTYYWKVEGALDSQIRSFSVNSVVDLRLEDNGNGYDIVNGGNTMLDVEVYDQGTLTGRVVLDTDERKTISGEEFVGGQHE